MNAVARWWGRAISVAFAVALAPALARAQTVPPAHPAFALHEASLRAEAVEAVLDAHARADADGQRRIEAALARTRGPLLAWPDAATLAAAGRAAEQPAGEAEGTLEALADALDLMVVPGAIDSAPQDDGASAASRPASLAVRVWPRWSRPAPATAVRVALVLVDPAGGSHVVRRAEVLPAAFQRPGFDLYFAAPQGVSPAARLALELEAAGAVARTADVPFAAIARLDAARARLVEALGAKAEPATVVLARELDALVAHGARSPHGIDWPSRLGGWFPDDRAPTLLPAPLDAPQRSRPTRWRARPSGPPAGVLLVFAPPGEDPAELHRGERGARWHALAEARQLDLVSASSAAEHVAAALEGALEDTRGSSHDRARELVVCVRAGAALPVQLALARLADDERWRERAPLVAAALPGAPAIAPGGAHERALVVAPGLPLELAATPERFATAPLGAVPLLDDATWPARLEAWLAARDAATRGGAATGSGDR